MVEFADEANETETDVNLRLLLALLELAEVAHGAAFVSDGGDDFYCGLTDLMIGWVVE